MPEVHDLHSRHAGLVIIDFAHDQLPLANLLKVVADAGVKVKLVGL
jgi:hypothetical protein